MWIHVCCGSVSLRVCKITAWICNESAFSTMQKLVLRQEHYNEFSHFQFIFRAACEVDFDLVNLLGCIYVAAGSESPSLGRLTSPGWNVHITIFSELAQALLAQLCLSRLECSPPSCGVDILTDGSCISERPPLFPSLYQQLRSCGMLKLMNHRFTHLLSLDAGSSFLLGSGRTCVDQPFPACCRPPSLWRSMIQHSLQLPTIFIH